MRGLIRPVSSSKGGAVLLGAMGMIIEPSMTLDCTTSECECEFKCQSFFLEIYGGRRRYISPSMMNNSSTSAQCETTTHRILDLRKLERGKSPRPQDVPQLDDTFPLHLLQPVQILLRPDSLLEQDLKVRLAEAEACEKLLYGRRAVLRRLS